VRNKDILFILVIGEPPGEANANSRQADATMFSQSGSRPMTTTAKPVIALGLVGVADRFHWG
jgi:hypothetical protein